MNDTARNASANVDNTSVQISPQHERQELVITNTGSTNISIAFGQAAVVGSGIFLVPYAVYFVSTAAGFTVSNQEIYAIGSAPGGTVAMFER